MLTQTDLFAPSEPIDDGAVAVVVRHPGAPIAVPCGFRDRHNNPCQRRGNWPIMDGAKQMLCRDRPMVHCDPACFRGDPPAPENGMERPDVVWSHEEGYYGEVD